MKQLSKQVMRGVAGGLSADDGQIEISRSEVTSLIAGLGGGVGAAVTIDSAGGLAALGAGAIPAAATYATGLGAAAAAGALVGNYLYNHSETVQDLAIGAVGYVVENFNYVAENFGFDVNTEFGGTIGDHSCTVEGGTAVNLLDDWTEMYV